MWKTEKKNIATMNVNVRIIFTCECDNNIDMRMWINSD